MNSLNLSFLLVNRKQNKKPENDYDILKRECMSDWITMGDRGWRLVTDSLAEEDLVFFFSFPGFQGGFCLCHVHYVEFDGVESEKRQEQKVHRLKLGHEFFRKTSGEVWQPLQ